jgi:hypothetical protein
MAIWLAVTPDRSCVNVIASEAKQSIDAMLDCLASFAMTTVPRGRSVIQRQPGRSFKYPIGGLRHAR